MTERGILFSGPMVRAILADIKTQTRRVLRRQPDPRLTKAFCGADGVWRFSHPTARGHGVSHSSDDVRLRYKAGDRLWVRETWCEDQRAANGYHYRATCECGIEGVDDGDGYAVLNKDGSLKSCWRPSLHMPRRASRITLDVTALRIERLQEISEADAIAEGVTKIRDHCYVIKGFDYDLAGLCHSSPVIPFAKLWDSINGGKAGKAWADNPWVVVTEFVRVQTQAGA